ncbi:MAG: TadE/TadG family type IV pilus assembly protein [Methylocella sp.]
MVLAKALGAFFGRERVAIAGVAAIELAMVSPLLVTGVVGAGELGITILRQTQVQFAAEAGIEYARANGANPQNPPDPTYLSNISKAVVNATSYTAITATPGPSQSCGCAAAAGVLPAACGSTCSDGSTAGFWVTVSAQAQFSPVIPNPWQTSTVTLAVPAPLMVRIR